MELSGVHGLGVIFPLAGAFLLFSMFSVLCVVAVRLLRYRDAASPELSECFSIERYAPMMRLVSEDDLAFLAAQPGYRPEIGKRLRRERRAILRMYLRELAADFRALHRAARKMVANSHEPDSELVGLLLRYQVTFWQRMAMIELRLMVPNARLPQIDLTPILKPMELMQIYVSET